MPIFDSSLRDNVFFSLLCHKLYLCLSLLSMSNSLRTHEGEKKFSTYTQNKKEKNCSSVWFSSVILEYNVTNVTIIYLLRGNVTCSQKKKKFNVTNEHIFILDFRF